MLRKPISNFSSPLPDAPVISGVRVNQRAPQFDFGQNWKSFSESALTSERVESARADFRDLTQGITLRGRTFLDIGFGQGLALCLAQEAGAKAYANDIDPKCVEALKATARFFSEFDADSIPTVIGSILDETTLQTLRQLSPVTEAGGFDIVHSWGVLHHTGAMAEATQRVASLVRPGGCLIIAIYNTHWSSPAWNFIKRAFVTMPALVQRIFTALFFPLIFIAKMAVMRRNPLQKERGMDFYHDVVDWIGGYPYEHATVGHIKALVESFGFKLERIIPAAVPTGCNQFVFRRQ
jgi:2-polyprenyl-3-methyl-5-hydroxy-6-metoxy-1,4-benzoquinol methylase